MKPLDNTVTIQLQLIEMRLGEREAVTGVTPKVMDMQSPFVPRNSVRIISSMTLAELVEKGADRT